MPTHPIPNIPTLKLPKMPDGPVRDWPIHDVVRLAGHYLSDSTRDQMQAEMTRRLIVMLERQHQDANRSGRINLALAAAATFFAIVQIVVALFGDPGVIVLPLPSGPR